MFQITWWCLEVTWVTVRRSGKGFRELFALGLIKRMPRISVIQAAGAAPFASLLSEFNQRPEAATFVDEPHPGTRSHQR